MHTRWWPILLNRQDEETHRSKSILGNTSEQSKLLQLRSIQNTRLPSKAFPVLGDERRLWHKDLQCCKFATQPNQGKRRLLRLASRLQDSRSYQLTEQFKRIWADLSWNWWDWCTQQRHYHDQSSIVFLEFYEHAQTKSSMSRLHIQAYKSNLLHSSSLQKILCAGMIVRRMNKDSGFSAEITRG